MPFIQDELTHAIKEAESSGLDWCVTLDSKRDPSKWVQFTWNSVNLRYPMTEPPSKTLTIIGWPDGNLERVSWEPGLSLTLSYGADESIPQIAEMVRKYIEVILEEKCVPENWAMSEQAI